MKILTLVILSMIFTGVLSISFVFASPPVDDNVLNSFDYKQAVKKALDAKAPKFLNLDKPCGDAPCIISANRPSPVNFKILAVDYLGLPLTAECDFKSGHTFKLGQTRVNCSIQDLFQNRVTGSFMVTVGVNVVKIPSWFKNTTLFWSEDKIGTTEYLNAISYLINNDIIQIPKEQTISEGSKSVPSWVLLTASDWAHGKKGDHEFSIALSWFVGHGLVTLK